MHADGRGEPWWPITPTWRRTALEWAAEINGKSPTAQRMLKFAFNLIDDGLIGQQVFAGEATRLAYMTDEAVEGRDAFLREAIPRLVGLSLVLLILYSSADAPSRIASTAACPGWVG